MKKFFIVFAAVLFIFTFSACTVNGTQDGKLHVSASVYPMYDFAKKIGGDKANVTCTVPAGTEPHEWEPNISDFENISFSDLFIYNGAGLEIWVEDLLGAVEIKNSAAVSEGIDIYGNDPHVWLNPLFAKKEMENIKNAMSEADPLNAAYYETNYALYAQEFDRLDEEFNISLSALTNKMIVVNHDAFGYLCRAYGITQVAVLGLNADQEPTGQAMVEIINIVKQNNINVIFFEELASNDVSQTIADETGARTDTLNPLEGLTQEQQDSGSDYFSVMRTNLAKIVSALS